MSGLTLNESASNEFWAQRDLRVLWHPCTQMKDHEQLPPIPIRRGEGVWLEDFGGKRYLDAISSWWVNLFGHCNPRIGAALTHQLQELEHVMLAGFTHGPAVELSERLVALAPPGLSKVFYTDNGSSAVEVALKMSFHYFRNQGCGEKTKFIALANSYHGETLGALAVGDVPLYRDTYHPLLMQAITVKSPDAYHRKEGEDEAEYARRAFEHMEATLAAQAHEVCAVIVEPLVQCAGHMRMYDPVYLSLLREACTRHGVHLIADEIAVGFGRTGTFFACEQASITADFLCVGKGLTGGYLPLAAVLTHNDIYQAFYADYPQLRAFLHSHSYTGNPLACRAALATLDIFQSDNVLPHNLTLARAMAAATHALRDHPHVGDVRQRGMILAIEMVKDKQSKLPYPWEERRGLSVYRHALDRGVLLRPLGNVIYMMPPYVITEAEIQYVAQVAAEGIDRATR